MITVEKVATREAFAALEMQWNELLAHSASDAIMLTHQWLSTWWDVFGAGRELCILVAREGDEILGIAPLLRRTVRQFGMPFRRLEFLASGEDEADEICSDYLDFILRSGRERAALEAIFDWILQKEARWDELRLTDIAGESKNLPLLREIGAARGLSFEVTREQICIYVPLSTHEELLKGLSGQYRKRLRKDRRAVAELGARLRVEVVEGVEGFETAFETLTQLHQQRWAARGEPGSFSSAKFTRFHREVGPKLLRRGWMKLWILHLDGEAICALYDLVYANKIFYYQSGMGIEKGGPILSPGLLLREMGMENALAMGLGECDFLKGDPTSYKFGWGGQTRPIVQIRLARGGVKELFYRGASRAVDVLRPLKRRAVGVLRRSKKGEKAA